jgi:regulator of sirC expression with transglutaminase-like and TPR domain
VQESSALYVHPVEARRMFRDFASAKIDRLDLARGALLIALEEYPRVDIPAYLARLDELTERVRARTSPTDPDVFKLGHIQAVLFDEENFNGNREHYYDVKNVYLNEVIDRKLGIPITLSILFLHIAHRIGLNAVGVGLPGHFLVKVQFDLNEVYVDCFSSGVTLTLKEIDGLLSQISSGQTRLTPDLLRGWSPRQTLARVLSNLQNLYTRENDMRRAAAAKERFQQLNDFAPEGE